MSWKMPNVMVITVTATLMLLATVETVSAGVATIDERQQDLDSEYDGGIKSLNMELIKSSILDKLGMQRPPELGDRLLLQDRLGKYNNDSGSYTVAPSQIRVKSNRIDPIGNGGTDVQSRKTASESTDNTINGRNVRDDDDDDYHVKTQKLIAFAQPHPTVQNLQGQYPLCFTFSEQIQHYRITKVILWVYKIPLDVIIDNSVVIIDVYRINPINLQQSLVSSIKRVLNTTEPSWVPIELQKNTSDWFKTIGEVKNLTLMVQAYYPDKNNTHDKLPYIIDSKKRDDNITEIPYLEVHTHYGHRNRRGAESEQRTYNGTTAAHAQCSRHSVTIDLKELGWKQIVWPEKLKFYYCSGECSSTTSVLSSSGREVHQCCVPRKTSDLFALYLDFTGPSRIRHGKISDMIVDECGCQDTDSIVRSLLKRLV
ncbi:growth/differentiation factor 8-like [Myzus persicae]|uniref:growth/differentiation factor 8-like n=1 Tax=Myzus persicae TaxID=13164 RepID=UPI000B931299|nr:growth/differentiation factor 8-like [Myzus persicae]XP_022180359.1 growth/differentiation factor 8-like [Myzus persicae]